MPFQIVRNDITKIRADAIVNSANPEPVFGTGTDYAIYMAAGAEKMLAERKKIGRILTGQAAATPAFGLPARYVIHTVGPAWEDGSHGELDDLASCYRNSLRLAKGLGCKSIAFPLISTGVYGFPKDRALEVALKEIREFLQNSDMEITLVVFNRTAFCLSRDLVIHVRQHIDDKYVEKLRREEYGDESAAASRERERRRRDHVVKAPGAARPGHQSPSMLAKLASEEEEEKRPRESFLKSEFKDRGEEILAELPDEALDFSDEASDSSDGASDFPESFSDFSVEIPEFYHKTPAAAGKAPGLAGKAPAAAGKAPGLAGKAPAAAGKTTAARPVSKPRLADIIRHLGESFQERLLRLIDERGFTDTEVYKKANIDRKLFSKIRCNPDYCPRKRTALALAVALRLNLDETIDLLGRAGLAFSPSSKADLIVEYCIENRIYDIFEINALLFEYDQPLLGC